jgi:hypothetical protein
MKSFGCLPSYERCGRVAGLYSALYPVLFVHDSIIAANLQKKRVTKQKQDHGVRGDVFLQQRGG